MNVPTLRDYYDWLARTPAELLQQCRRTAYQASGPGGQKRNRVYSAIRLEHAPSGLRSESSASREAARNRKDALRKLRLALAIAGARTVPLPNSDTLSVPDAPNFAELRAPIEYPAFRAKINPEHVDFPPNVLRALVLFRACAAKPRAAAERLGVSTSAFVRYLKLDSQVLAEANQIRKDLGRPGLQ